MKKMTSVKKSIITAVCIALCVVLPQAFHAIPNAGTIYCPMHIPVLLCGLVCGWSYGLLCGIAGPLLSSLITGMPPAAAAFIGALSAGLLASEIKKNNGYPRISLTVPSIVIMVPGLYLYRAIYNFGIMSLTEAVSWFTSAIMIIIMLPLGLIFARILTDRTFRFCT